MFSPLNNNNNNSSFINSPSDVNSNINNNESNNMMELNKIYYQCARSCLELFLNIIPTKFADLIGLLLFFFNL